MLIITILAIDILCDNLYYVNVFQNTHIAAYGKTHMHTSPKVFIKSWINVTQLVKRKTRGYVNQEIGIQNIKVLKRNKYHMNIVKVQ